MQMTNTYVLEKRTAESIWYDIDCTNLLDAIETITTITSVASDQIGLTFLAPAVNPAPITFPDKVVAPAGKVISVKISGGVIEPPQVNQLYTIRALFVTNEGNTREATVLLNVTNLPVQTGRIC
jgi:hypothetical protein